jgi:glycosyltransferase involved in cell wall biosynthesis
VVRRGLIITYYFPPVGGGGVQRWAKFIKYLSKQDWHFTIITRDHTQNEYIDDSLLKDIPNTLNIITTNDYITKQRYKFFKSNSTYWQRWISSLFFITDNRKKWVKSVWPKVKEEINSSKYDVVVCSIPPYSVSDLAIKIKDKFSSIPVVLDLRDPWSINPYKIYPTPIHRYLDEKKELDNIKKIDGLISVYESTFDYYSNNIDGFEKIESKIISNGYDEEDFIKLKSRSLPNPKSFNIAFSGTFYSHLNNPSLFLRALAKLKNEGQQIKFHHIGTSVYDVNALARKFGVEDLLVLWGYQSHKNCLEILNSMDAFVVILESKFQNADKTIGGKVYEYLRLRKPILGLVPENGEAARLISKTKSGIICESSNIEKIINAIMGLRLKKFDYIGIDQYSRENLAQQLNIYLLKMINKHKNG